MRFSSRQLGSWPWAVLGVGPCLVGIVTQLCAQEEPEEPRYRPRSIVFVLDMSGPPPPIATDDNQIPGTYDVYDGGEKTELALVLSGDVSTVWWTLKGTPWAGRVDLVPIGENPDDADIDPRGMLMVGDFIVPGQEDPGYAAIWVWPSGATEASFDKVKGDAASASSSYRLQKREQPDGRDDENQIPGTYDVYDRGGDKTGLVLVLSGDASAVDWTLKGTPYSGRFENPSASGNVSRGAVWGGNFPVPGRGDPGIAAMWIDVDEDARYRASELKLRDVKGGGWTWQYRLQRRAGTDEQDAAGAHRDVRDERLAEWLTRAVELVENAIRRGAEWEWAVITCKNHQAYLQQPFTDEIDLSALTVRASGSTSDRPLVWAVAQAMAYLYKHGRHPTGQIIVMSNGMDLCAARSPGGGARAVQALNDQLRSIKLPGRSPSTTGGARRSQRFGTVELLPMGFGLLRQGGPGEVLGAPGETVDDMLPRVKALIEGSDKQVTVSVVATDPTLSEKDAAALRSIAEAGGGHFSAATTPDAMADAMSQVIGLPDPTPEGPGGEQPVPDAAGEWRTHKDDAQGITMQIAPGWAVGKGLEEVLFELRGPAADGQKHEGALVCLATEEGGTLDDFIAQACQWANDQVGHECKMQRGATLQCPEGDVATLRFTDPESPESYVLAFVTLGKHNGYILGFQGPQGDEESVRGDLEKMAESMQVP